MTHLESTSKRCACGAEIAPPSRASVCRACVVAISSANDFDDEIDDDLDEDDQ